MDRIVIAGGLPLKGKVRISGSKNSSLALMVASLMCDRPVELMGIPDLADINSMEHLLCSMGVEVSRRNGHLLIDPSTLRWAEAPYDIVRKMRASFFVIGPLLARTGEARVSLPGGCAIGTRPVNFHLEVLKALGARVETAHGYVTAAADRLQGAPVRLPFPSVGATVTAMCAASLAKGKTVIENPAREPEIVDLAEFLNAMGATIRGAGSDRITIRGVHRLHGRKYQVMPDRIEAGTYLVSGAIGGGPVEVCGCDPGHLESLIQHLRDAGVSVRCMRNRIQVERKGPVKPLKVIRTQPYPGFPTDLQAQLMALLSIAEGESTIEETIFENRFMHVSELCRMGADITVEGNIAVIRGVKGLSGAQVMASDLRASAALVLAGVVAQGETEILRVYHLDRGYEALEKKLSRLGARIDRKTGKPPEVRERDLEPVTRYPETVHV
jgi:UDP-N-acetylglucosamine 1-carboxyvinyltransferase